MKILMPRNALFMGVAESNFPNRSFSVIFVTKRSKPIFGLRIFVSLTERKCTEPNRTKRTCFIIYKLKKPTSMSIPVMRYMRKKILGDPTSEELYYLKPVPGHSRTVTEEDVAAETEAIGALSAEDVVHVMRAFVRSMKKILVRGDKVKIPGFGIFYTTFNSEGTGDEKECTVKSIKRINVRFTASNKLRFVNDSNAETRGATNNVEFYIKSEAKTANANPAGENDEAANGGAGNGDGGAGNDEAYVDPNS
jgi:predicted histone-like DNA-binding protein